jgi:ABC-type methionine transport system permease subunit
MMGKIVVKIVTAVPGADGAGGLGNYAMLRQYKADVVRLTTDIAEAQVSGGAIPVTAAEYALIVA